MYEPSAERERAVMSDGAGDLQRGTWARAPAGRLARRRMAQRMVIARRINLKGFRSDDINVLFCEKGAVWGGEISRWRSES